MSADLHYPLSTLAGDYLRAVAGLGVGLGVLTTASAAWPVAVVFGGVTVVFGAFGARTVQRHLTRVGLYPEGVTRTALGTRKIAWDELSAVKLRYYGTRRERGHQGGFMQLKLRGPEGGMTFESNLEGFDYLVWRAARAARENRVRVDPTTAGNMLSLGVDIDEATAPPAEVAELARRVEHGGDPGPG